MSLYCTSVRYAIKSKIADSNPHVHFVGFVTGIVGLCMTVRIVRIVVLWAWCLLSTSGHMTATMHDVKDFLSSHLLSS